MPDTSDSLDAPLEAQSLDEFVSPLPDPEAPTIDADKTLNYEPLAQFLGYASPTDEQAEQLKFIWQHFSQEHEKRGDIIQAIKDAYNSLSSPEVGQSKLSKLFIYTRLLDSQADIEKERQAYLK